MRAPMRLGLVKSRGVPLTLTISPVGIKGLIQHPAGQSLDDRADATEIDLAVARRLREVASTQRTDPVMGGQDGLGRREARAKEDDFTPLWALVF
jgi:hypothetical protein